MASKQLGKFRQWAGEIVSSNKTTVTDDFKELEQDVELRRAGIDRIYAVSEVYQKALSKKVDMESEQAKVLPVEGLGLALIAHGSDFGSEAAFAQIQEEFANSFQETFIQSLETLREMMKEYSALRKKLDSRRLTLDAAISKNTKAKKEKEKKEAEEELKAAKARYEETANELQTRMYFIQDNEIQQLRDLTDLLDLELAFVTQYHEILSEVKKEWVDESSIQRVELDRPKTALHSFIKREHPNGSDSDQEQELGAKDRAPRKSSISGTSTPNGSISNKTGLSRFVPGSLRSRKGSTRSKTKSFSHLEDTIDDGDTRTMDSDRSRGLLERDSGDIEEDDTRDITRPPPQTFKDRSRANSRASNGPFPGMSRLAPPLSSRASSAVPSKKIVRALFEYSGEADELHFRPGDEIVVVSEVSEGWWEGECNGRTGLFPSNYVEEIQKPALPPRPPTLTASSTPRSRTVPPPSGNDSSSEEEVRRIALSRRPSAKSQRSLRQKNADIPAAYHPFDEPFGDQHEQDNDHQDVSDYERGLLTSNTPDSPTSTSASKPKSRSGSISLSTLAGKKAPPPPPSRRSQTPSSMGTGRRIPLRSKSSGTLPGHLSTSTMGSDARSPFANDADGDGDHGQLSDGGMLLCSVCGCEEFQQNPFKPKGHCSSCFHSHA
ncbi:hypothetical protein FRB99_008291 [Tulasnella sp. 403]|nr:hypothetical protein FRB99_008291 [Tulasnella sp. 403]